MTHAPLHSPALRSAARAGPLLLYALPLALALLLAVAQGTDAAGWRALAADPQTPRALLLSVATALLSTALSLAACLFLVTHLHGGPLWRRLARALAPMLAVPHAAFAIGLALLVMPAGLLARLAALAAGWNSPPAWPTVHDPNGIGLVLVLVGKETPFLLWTTVALLQRPELAQAIRGWQASAATLGYTRAATWWRVLWPQLLPRLGWPLLAVLAYGLGVVDVALIVGPASPPTLALVAWNDLVAGDAARNAQGAAAALLLAAVLATLAGAAVALHALTARACAGWATNGRRGRMAGATATGARVAACTLGVGLALYAAVAGLLLFSSFTGVWSFPALLPQRWTAVAWLQVADSVPLLLASAALAATVASASTLLVVCWLAATPAHWDARVLPWVLAPLVVPPLLWVAGLYSLALRLRLDGTWTGLAWAHGLATLPYVFIALQPAWRSFDRRYVTTALALGRTPAASLLQVKLPMLAAPTVAALAVGFAVSVAQYLPTQLIGAGRLATVTTEAVTLAAGGQRHTAAAFALLQALLPLGGFALAAWVGRRPWEPHR